MASSGRTRRGVVRSVGIRIIGQCAPSYTQRTEHGSIEGGRLGLRLRGRVGSCEGIVSEDGTGRDLHRLGMVCSARYLDRGVDVTSPPPTVNVRFQDGKDWVLFSFVDDELEYLACAVCGKVMRQNAANLMRHWRARHVGRRAT